MESIGEELHSNQREKEHEQKQNYKEVQHRSNHLRYASKDILNPVCKKLLLKYTINRILYVGIFGQTNRTYFKVVDFQQSEYRKTSEASVGE